MKRPLDDQADGQRALRHLHRVLILDGHHAGGHLDVVDLAQRHRQDGEKVWLVGHLAHPHAGGSPRRATARDSATRGVDRDCRGPAPLSCPNMLTCMISHASLMHDAIRGLEHPSKHDDRSGPAAELRAELVRVGDGHRDRRDGGRHAADPRARVCTSSPRVVWVVAAVLLVVLVVAVTVQWIRHPTVARSHARNPQMAHFYGAAPDGVDDGRVRRDAGRQGPHRRRASPSTWPGCCGRRAPSAACSPRRRSRS